MKKKFLSIVIVILCSALVLCACGAPETASGQISPATEQTQPATQQTQPATQPATEQTETAAPAVRGNADLALASMLGLIEAQDPQQAAQFVVGADEGTLQSLVEHYPKTKGDVTVTYQGAFEDYDIFSYDIVMEDQSFTESGMVLLLPQEDSYMICMDKQIQQNMIDNCLCSSCGGAGGSNLGGMVCGICAGTGQQYYPNMYFDGTMWQGQYMACSGCGGAGQTGSIWTPCGFCGGDGWNFR